MTCLTFATALVAMLAAPGPAASGQARECDDLDVVSYSVPQPDLLKRISIIREVPAPDELAKLEVERSPQGTARLFFLRPDYTRPGVWTTRVYVVGNTARPLAAEVRFGDHVTYDVKATWINEKLVHFNVAWGRIVATDLILNVETWDFLYIEEANYGNLVLPCDEKRRAVRK